MFPTGVGMNRFASGDPAADPGVPHRRGDEPQLICVRNGQGLCSPQAWG